MKKKKNGKIKRQTGREGKKEGSSKVGRGREGGGTIFYYARKVSLLYLLHSIFFTLNTRTYALNHPRMLAPPHTHTHTYTHTHTHTHTHFYRHSDANNFIIIASKCFLLQISVVLGNLLQNIFSFKRIKNY